MCGPTYRYYPQLLIKRGFPTSRFKNMWFFRCSFEIVSKLCKEEEGMRMPCPCSLVLCAKMSRESAKKGLKLSTTLWLKELYRHHICIQVSTYSEVSLGSILFTYIFTSSFLSPILERLALILKWTLIMQIVWLHWGVRNGGGIFLVLTTSDNDEWQTIDKVQKIPLSN